MKSTTPASRYARWLAPALLAVLVAAACGSSARSSTSGSGQQAAGESGSPSVSGDGAKVAFQSAAANLVEADTNGAVDIFVRAEADKTTVRVSVGAGGAQADGASTRPAISTDGRYVAFVSAATNLVAGDTNGAADVFVRDTQAGTTTRVSVGAGGAQADGARNLVASDTNGRADAFVRDTQAGTTTRVSLGAGGAQADGETRDGPAISGDGRYVAFVSEATNLVAGDTNGNADAFVRDTQAGTTTRVSVGVGGAQSAGETYPGVAISADGRYVAFTSNGVDLVSPSTSGLFTDVYRRDRQAGVTVLVSTPPSGAFETLADNLPSSVADTNGTWDVVFRRR